MFWNNHLKSCDQTFILSFFESCVIYICDWYYGSLHGTAFFFFIPRCWSLRHYVSSHCKHLTFIFLILKHCKTDIDITTEHNEIFFGWFFISWEIIITIEWKETHTISNNLHKNISLRKVRRYKVLLSKIWKII